jgi:hypothetical protein
MNLISKMFALMLASVVFISLFVYQFFQIGINLELLFKDIVVFFAIFTCSKFLFGHIETIFELGRKTL